MSDDDTTTTKLDKLKTQSLAQIITTSAMAAIDRERTIRAEFLDNMAQQYVQILSPLTGSPEEAERIAVAIDRLTRDLVRAIETSGGDAMGSVHSIH